MLLYVLQPRMLSIHADVSPLSQQYVLSREQDADSTAEMSSLWVAAGSLPAVTRHTSLWICLSPELSLYGVHLGT